MNNKTIFLTEDQLKRVYEAALKESLVVNCDFVKMVVKFLDAHFRPVKYDDINADGDVIQPYAIQVLSMDKAPLQTIRTDTLIGKLANKFAHKIKDEKDRHKFFKQVIDDWIHKRISPEGILSVNMIKENKYSLNEVQTSESFASVKRLHIQRTGKPKETLLLFEDKIPADEIRQKYNQELNNQSDVTDKQAMSASLILTSDELIDKLFFNDGIRLTVSDIKPFLVTKNDVDQNKRCYEFLNEFVIAN